MVISVKSLFNLHLAGAGPDCSPGNIKNCVENMLKILDGKCFIDIFGPGRLDPKFTIEETVSNLVPYVKAGKIGGIGLSETKAETIRRAASVSQISSIELELSLFSRDPRSNGQTSICGELGYR